MDVLVVARYLDFTEAEVVASALRSAGLNPFLPDRERGLNWATEQVFLGGSRVMVPACDLDDARAILSDAREQMLAEVAATGEVWDLPRKPTSLAWTGLGLFVSLFCTPVAGWNVAAWRRRPTWKRTVALWFSIVLSLLLASSILRSCAADREDGAQAAFR